MNKDIAFKIFSFLTKYDQIKACYRVKTIFSPYFKEWEKIGGVYSIFTKENTPNYLGNYDFQDYENIGCIQHIEDIWRVAKYYVKTLPDKKKIMDISSVIMPVENLHILLMDIWISMKFVRLKFFGKKKESILDGL